MIRVAICGTGTMGRLVLDTIEAQQDLQAVGFVEPLAQGDDKVQSGEKIYPVYQDPGTLFEKTHPDVVVDFTNAQFTPTLVEAALASRFFDSAEIIELHHDRKVDSPSGTALTTARLMRAARDEDFTMNVPALEHLPHARGGDLGGIPIHSVRLPGFVASQEVIFGGFGQTLTLRHDTTGREAFMPGVVIAVHEVMNRTALVEGLDQLVGLGK